HFFAAPHCWATLDYASVESRDISAEMTWTVMRAGTAHGLCVWFDAMLGEGIGLTNAPGGPETIYGQAFFPLSGPVSLGVGDTVSVFLGAELLAEDYVCDWTTRVMDEGHPDRIKASSNHSAFHGAPLSLTRLRNGAAGYTPTLNEDGKIDALVLVLMNSGTPL